MSANSATTVVLSAAGVALFAVLVKAWYAEGSGQSGGSGKHAARNKKRRENQKAKLSSVVEPAPKGQSPELKEKETIKTEAKTSENKAKKAKVPLAEQHAQKQRGKQPSSIADMLDKEVEQDPSVARVLSVQPRKQVQKGKEKDWPSLPAPVSSVADAREDPFEQDPEERREKEEMWQTVTPKTLSIKTKPLESTTLGQTPTATAKTIPGLPEEASKKARQNAAKRAAAKQAKEEAEAERIAVLNSHRKDRAKTINAQQNLAFQNKNAKSQSFFNSNKNPPKSANKEVSGGMVASVQNGALVWE